VHAAMLGVERKVENKPVAPDAKRNMADSMSIGSGGDFRLTNCADRLYEVLAPPAKANNASIDHHMSIAHVADVESRTLTIVRLARE
jgi:hypothetical protein